jgi:hypothetical protein
MYLEVGAMVSGVVQTYVNLPLGRVMCTNKSSTLKALVSTTVT